MAVLYQVEQQGRQTAFVGEDGTGLVGLYPLLLLCMGMSGMIMLQRGVAMQSPLSKISMA